MKSPISETRASHALAMQPPMALPADELVSLLDGCSLIIGIKDSEGRYVFVSQPFAELFGLQAADIIGCNDNSLFPPRMANRLRDNDHEVLEQGRELSFHERLVIGGEQRLYLTRKFPRFDPRGRPDGICLIATDITRQNRVEQALESIALSVSAATGSEVFDLIVQALAQALEIDLAFVARLIERNPDRLQAISTWYDNQLQSVPCYLTADTPCADVIAEGFTYISGDLASTHPRDEMAVDFNLNSYAGYPLTDHEGQVVGVLSVCHHGPLPDRTIVEHLLHIFSVRACAELERARTEAALRASETSYRAIFENAEDAIFVHDLDTGAIVDVNWKACQTYGYSRDEMLVIDVAELGSGIPPYTGDRVACYLKMARQGIPQRFEWHRRNKDGSLHWDEVTLNRVTLSGVDRILAFTREITERKEWESTLVRSENRLRAVVTSALDSIITMDSGGRIVGFNPAAESCFGWRETEVQGRSLADVIIPQSNRKAHQRGLERYLQSGESRFIGRRVELTALRRDGTEFPVELAIAVSQERDDELFVGFLRDISERHEAESERVQLEAQLRQSQKLEAIGHLAGGVAHDFNNILTGVVGYLNLAREMVGKVEPDRLRRYLEQASSSADRAGELIRQLLTFSRGRGGNPVRLNLCHVVRQCATLLHSTLPSSVEIDYQFSDEVAPIFIDPVHAEQILLNLCINARDAMEGKGRITIRVQAGQPASRRCASCQEFHSGEFVQLSVGDTGCGISPEQVERIFEPFFSTKAPGLGSGMGLAIVHGIVHEAGGHLGLESRIGSGTTFHVLLPVHAGGEQDLAVNIRGQRPLAQRKLQGTIMVIDDETEVAGYMREQLVAWGLDVIEQHSPQAALAALVRSNGRPDAVVVDYTMPGMNGLELVEKLRALAPDLPVIIYSGYIEEIPRSRLEELGLDEPMRKPVDPDRLYVALERFLLNTGNTSETN